jgi:hypothetical protein
MEETKTEDRSLIEKQIRSFSVIDSSVSMLTRLQAGRTTTLPGARDVSLDRVETEYVVLPAPYPVVTGDTFLSG